jgi:hypothetical protein
LKILMQKFIEINKINCRPYKLILDDMEKSWKLQCKMCNLEEFCSIPPSIVPCFHSQNFKALTSWFTVCAKLNFKQRCKQILTMISPGIVLASS